MDGVEQRVRRVDDRRADRAATRTPAQGTGDLPGRGIIVRACRPSRNRIVSTPHATGWGHGGLIDPREVDYHVRKAAGGCALVMTSGSASVDATTAASYGSISLWDERNKPALRALPTASTATARAACRR
jgi:hypothetical protein